MTKLDDLFDLIDLEQAIAAGYVRTQAHPNLPYTIYNYSEACAYERAWNPVTRQCRGLIARTGTGEVLARPFPKFLNVGEPGAYTARLDEPVIVTEKMDGSLGVGYPVDGGGYAIATRGSFTSEQAQHATVVYQEEYAQLTQVPAGITPLWEIIYPANRIVVRYGYDDLVLLGGVDIATGATISANETANRIAWFGPVVETFPYRTYADALADPPRDNREGIVIYFPESRERLKAKYSRYVELHRIVTGMNERVVWEHLGAGKPLDELIEPLPSEFQPWVHSVAERLASARDAVLAAASSAFADVLARAIAGHPVEPGVCACGCGSVTPLATSTRKGYRIGEPTRYVPRHTLRSVPVEFDPRTGCWLWTGSVATNGYGHSRSTTAHRRLYELMKGPVRDGYDLDHLCRVRNCVNPGHLEETTRSENALRGAKTRLTREMVAAIRSSSNSNTSELARQMGVPVSTVDAVRRGETWTNDATEVVRKPVRPEFRKAFAALAAGHELRPYLFMMLDGRDPRPAIWKTLRPSGANTMAGGGEEAA